MQWTDPKYADLVAVMKQAQATGDDQPPVPRSSARPNTIRGFVIPGTPPAA
ncbi:hypothetical protein QMK19_21225 [Streptomyces sp. H10-C2]|uniref:hypothetical protein n=1 Tax=unclassified Streptomyces TaxID=2593676 RepID=UPI0024BA69D0|nr:MULTISPECIES: hypothetical protein [unclassified Streptomyces]MDJ0345367.1 hypothetical protein [Streptomyces sp. PH10-H1]MDJ0372122.1 hypothetical protein [Streptomyces sp. H10-C2]